jgi:hypothetical protein
MTDKWTLHPTTSFTILPKERADSSHGLRGEVMTTRIETTTIWEIAVTQSGYEKILRNGVSICAISGDIEEARSILDGLIAASARTLQPA